MSQDEEELTWPLQPRIDELEAHDLEDVRGAARLGEPLAFRNAPDQLARVIRDLKDLKLEKWEELPEGVRNTLPEVAAQFNSTIQQMKELSSAEPNAADTKNQLEAQLNSQFEQFRTIVHPLTMRARIRDEMSGMPSAQAQDQVDELRGTVETLQSEANALRDQISSLAPLAEAQREAVGASGAAELSDAYEREANRHEESWRRWLYALVGALLLAGVGGIIIVAIFRPPNDATNAELITAIARDLLFVGLLLYLVRITSLQFRVHRHLEAVARNKAAALRTFNRLVAGQTEPDVRAAVAAALANAVFTSDQTGFIGSSEDNVTIIERIVGPMSQRVSGG